MAARIEFRSWHCLLAALALAACESASAATLPAGAFAQLSAVPNSDIANLADYALTTGAGTGGDPYKVNVWYDQVVTGDPTLNLSDAATAQDFGTDVVGRRPSLLQQTMPNGSSYWTLGFSGGKSATNTIYRQFDVLSNKDAGALRITTPSSTVSGVVAAGGFNAGETVSADGMYTTTTVDPTYNADNTALSWAVVFRADDTTLTGQRVFNGTTSDIGATASQNHKFATFFQDSADADADLNVRNLLRQGAGSGSNLISDLDNLAAPTEGVGSWYIATGSWGDITNGSATNNFISKLLKEGEMSTISTVTQTAIDPDGLGTLQFARLGLLTATGTGNDQPVFTGQIAELIIWNSALSDTQLNDAMSYLQEKYFVPEPSSIMLVSMGLFGLGVVGWRRHRKLA